MDNAIDTVHSAAGMNNGDWTQPFEIRGSRIQGSGAFATRDIRAGELIAKYSGEIIDADEAYSRYEDDNMIHHHTFLFALQDGRFIDAGVGGNDARFINHSCDPNSEAFEEDGQVMVRALQDIRAGNEIVYDYRLEREGKPKKSWVRLYACHCGAKRCRGTMLINLPAKWLGKDKTKRKGKKGKKK
jgi:SET domain-containing protein